MQAQSDLGQHGNLTTGAVQTQKLPDSKGLGYWDSWFFFTVITGETVIKAARGLHVITNSRVVAELALYRIVGQQDE